MRTKSIISIIRKYGLRSKKLYVKNRIKYEDALKAIKGYENSELQIIDVVDNVRAPHKSKSHKCQVPGCGMAIRYEYTLSNKVDASELVVGSTCVWTLLGLSKLEIKTFQGLESAIKEYYALQGWLKDNADVAEKLEALKANKLMNYRPFWVEVEVSRLTDEDTEYIRGLDVDALVLKDIEAKRLKEEGKQYKMEALAKTDSAYAGVLKALDTLVKRYPKSSFFVSLNFYASHLKLSDKQQKAIKASYNKLWYRDNVKGTAKDKWNTCEAFVYNFFRNALSVGSSSDVLVLRDMTSYSTKALNDLVNSDVSLSEEDKNAWTSFKVKYGFVL